MVSPVSPTAQHASTIPRSLQLCDNPKVIAHANNMKHQANIHNQKRGRKAVSPCNMPVISFHRHVCYLYVSIS